MLHQGSVSLNLIIENNYPEFKENPVKTYLEKYRVIFCKQLRFLNPSLRLCIPISVISGHLLKSQSMSVSLLLHLKIQDQSLWGGEKFQPFTKALHKNITEPITPFPKFNIFSPEYYPIWTSSLRNETIFFKASPKALKPSSVVWRHLIKWDFFNEKISYSLKMTLRFFNENRDSKALHRSFIPISVIPLQLWVNSIRSP